MADRVCDFCREQAASVFYQWWEVTGRQGKAACGVCAAEMGLGGDMASAAEMFSKVCRHEAAAPAAGQEPEKCPNCGTASCRPSSRPT